MCGIVGFWRQKGYDEADAFRLTAMADEVKHRGPDDFGYLALNVTNGSHKTSQDVSSAGSSNVFLGSRRLAIIDTSPEGRQPMSNEDGSIFVVFNGEIYNHIELRRELESRGHVFHSHSDTEVIVHAYEEWGADCAKRFNGMWAYVIWDQRQRCMICSRDRFGIKPLYYTMRDDQFYFGSEIKAILAGLETPATPDYATLADIMIHGGLTFNTHTCFSDVMLFPPATNMIITMSGMQQSRYWEYTDQSETYDYKNAEQTFRELFTDSVKLHLRSDVPVGIMLSGGVDSSAVAMTTSAMMPNSNSKVFTAVFPGSSIDEDHYASFVAERAGLEMFRMNYDDRNLIDDLASVIYHMESPPQNGQLIARWQLLKLVGQHGKVVLEGQGADEMLAGYIKRYFRPYVLSELGDLSLTGLPGTVCRLFSAGIMTKNIFGSHFEFMKTGMQSALKRLKPRLRQREALGDVFQLPMTSEQRSIKSASPYLDPLSNALYRDHSNQYLPCLLHFGDKISMGHSVESRVPFLDYRLVEFVFGLPFRAKFNGSETKYIARQAFKGIVPNEILARRDKIGFETPLWQWLAPHMESTVIPLLRSKKVRERGILNEEYVNRALDKCMQGEHRYARDIYSWLALELWFQQFIDGAGDRMFQPKRLRAPSII